MRGYERHERVPLIVEDPQPDPLAMMRELAAQVLEEEPPPPVTHYPSTLAVRRSRVVDQPVETPLVTSAEWSET